mmetsp:Transcript_9910/g.16301  ORF Transcript_9910/g.16301 Transcript_9910/m.16301 type:complete len:96 (+) Transcript_9910:358-645(+)
MENEIDGDVEESGNDVGVEGDYGVVGVEVTCGEVIACVEEGDCDGVLAIFLGHGRATGDEGMVCGEGIGVFYEVNNHGELEVVGVGESGGAGVSV